MHRAALLAHGELSGDALRYQIEAFRSYAIRAGLSVPEAFAHWATSKDLSAGDRRAIWQALSPQNAGRP